MCGACGGGPIASYYEGDVVQVSYPREGIGPETIALVISVRDDWGLELKFKDMSIRWFDWDHFTCTIAHPDFRIARVDPKRLNFPRDNNKSERTTNYQMTIGQGWLSNPCVLPGKRKHI